MLCGQHDMVVVQECLQVEAEDEERVGALDRIYQHFF